MGAHTLRRLNPPPRTTIEKTCRRGRSRSTCVYIYIPKQFFPCLGVVLVRMGFYLSLSFKNSTTFISCILGGGLESVLHTHLICIIIVPFLFCGGGGQSFPVVSECVICWDLVDVIDGNTCMCVWYRTTLRALMPLFTPQEEFAVCIIIALSSRTPSHTEINAIMAEEIWVLLGELWVQYCSCVFCIVQATDSLRFHRIILEISTECRRPRLF